MRWEEQVEKALLLPVVEVMFRMVETMQAKEKIIGRRVPDHGVRLSRSRYCY